MTIFDETTFQVSITQANLVANESTNSVYRYQFPGTASFKNAKIALAKVNLFYSWFNITAEYGNNTYQYIWTDGSGSTTKTVTMPDGYYTVSDLNTYLQSELIANGYYLVDGDGNNVYYLEIIENPTFYAIQLNLYPFPTALPSGYTNPNSLTFPVSASTPQFVINNNAFQTLIGFSPASYPASIESTTQSFTSDNTPQLNPVASVFMACNLVNNTLSNPSNLVYPFTADGVGFGSLVESSPNEYVYLDVQDGLYSNIEVVFLDQQFRRIQINDTNIVVQFIFKIKKE